MSRGRQSFARMRAIFRTPSSSQKTHLRVVLHPRSKKLCPLCGILDRKPACMCIEMAGDDVLRWVLHDTCSERPLRAAPRDHQPPTASNRQPPTITNRQSPLTTKHQPSPTANCQLPPTANHQPSTGAIRQTLYNTVCSGLFLDHEAESVPVNVCFCWRYEACSFFFSPLKDIPGQKQLALCLE